MGSTSALADRLSIAHGPSARRFHLSVQSVLGCGHQRRASVGNCDGGDDAAVYRYAARFGIPSESCSNYMAVDTTCFDDSPVTNRNKPECYTCKPRDNSGINRCNRVLKHKKLFVESFGVCSGYDAMKREIHTRGPISCSIDATDDQVSRREREREKDASEREEKGRGTCERGSLAYALSKSLINHIHLIVLCTWSLPLPLVSPAYVNTLRTTTRVVSTVSPKATMRPSTTSTTSSP